MKKCPNCGFVLDDKDNKKKVLLIRKKMIQYKPDMQNKINKIMTRSKELSFSSLDNTLNFLLTIEKFNNDQLSFVLDRVYNNLEVLRKGLKYTAVVVDNMLKTRKVDIEYEKKLFGTLPPYFKEG